MTGTLYTVGYSGRTPAEIKSLVESRDAILIDIRFVAVSRHPQWRKAAFAHLLGDRYLHCPALGNVNYKGGPVRIADLDAGVRLLESLPGAFGFLMCTCRDGATCHRAIVGSELRLRGFSVQEFEMQPRLL